MKKLMIAATIAMLGIAANAASCTWSTDWFYAIDTDHSTYTDGGFTGKYWVLMGDFSDISVNTEGVLSAVGSYTYGNDGAAAGDAINGSDGIGGALTGLTAADNGSNVALVIFYDQEGGWYGFDTDVIAGIVDSDPGAGVTGSDATPITFTTYFDGEYNCMGATTPAAAVPEPTTGLLMLLGMAGLALRRRRA